VKCKALFKKKRAKKEQDDQTKKRAKKEQDDQTKKRAKKQ
jgi:hypothetical protein